MSLSELRCQLWSLLSWERGLKCPDVIFFFQKVNVAPLVGAWIEISFSTLATSGRVSLLSWERGLKYRHRHSQCDNMRRSSRGSVD